MQSEAFVARSNDTTGTVTMRSLAADLGVSPMTVSRVLNGFPNVRPQTRRRVLEKVREVGYDPDRRLRKPNAEKIRHVAIHCIGAKLSHVGEFDFYPRLYYHCIHKLKALGLRGHLVDLNAGSDLDRDVVGGCGSVVLLSRVDTAVWHEVSARHPDLKVVNVLGEAPGVPTVAPDEVGGGELAARHLAVLGHRHCACLTELCAQGFRQRYAGFFAYMSSPTLDGRVDLIPVPDEDNQQVGDAQKRAAIDAYLQRCGPNRPTAFFTPNGYLTYFLYTHLARRGLRMREDYCLIGYDDLSYLRHVEQQITRVVFDIRELGIRAAECVADQIERPGPGSRLTMIPVELIDHGSCIAVDAMGRQQTSSMDTAAAAAS